jgi:hypothetical protein
MFQYVSGTMAGRLKDIVYWPDPTLWSLLANTEFVAYLYPVASMAKEPVRPLGPDTVTLTSLFSIFASFMMTSTTLAPPLLPKPRIGQVVFSEAADSRPFVEDVV